VTGTIKEKNAEIATVMGGVFNGPGGKGAGAVDSRNSKGFKDRGVKGSREKPFKVNPENLFIKNLRPLESLNPIKKNYFN